MAAIPVEIGSALISGGAGLLNTLIGSASGANLNSKNRNWQAEQNTLQYERQRQLTEDSPLLQKIGLQKAGISAAAMNGYSGGTATVSASNTPSSNPEYVPLDVNSVLNAYLGAKELENNVKTAQKQRDLLDKQGQLLDQNIEKQKMDNEVQRNTIDAYERASSKPYFVDDDGTKHYSDDSDYDSAVNSYMKNHNNDLPELVKPSPLKSFEAVNIPKVLSDVQSQIQANEFYKVHYDLMQKVDQDKLVDPDVRRALARMDVAQFNSLLATIRKIDSDIDLNKYSKAYISAQTAGQRANTLLTFTQNKKVQQEIKTLKNSTPANILEQYDDDHDLKSFVKTTGKMILSTLPSLVGLAH